MKKHVSMIAGPNGAGKTTFAKALFSEKNEIYDEFLNADEIARGLSPLHPESVSKEAGIILIKKFIALLAANKSFIFETTAAGKNYVKYLKEARHKGYEVNLMFLWLSSPDQAVKRVAQRVRQNGHDIPEEVIVRWYPSGLKNLINLYLPLADTAIIIDNSRPESSSKNIIAQKKIDDTLQILDKEIWEKIQRTANA